MGELEAEELEDFVKGLAPDLVVVAVEVLVIVAVLLDVELVVCERDCVIVLEFVVVPVELIVPRGILLGRLLTELDRVIAEERVLDAVAEEESVVLLLLEVVAVADDVFVGSELLDEVAVEEVVLDSVLVVVAVLELVTVRLDVVEAVDVLLLVEVFVLEPEAVELLELVDVLDVVVVLVDVKLAREDGVDGREGTAVSLGLLLRVAVLVEDADIVGRAFAAINSLGPKGAQEGCGKRTSIVLYLKCWSGGSVPLVITARVPSKKQRSLILYIYIIFPLGLSNLVK